MKRIAKVFLSIILLGLIILMLVMAGYNWNFNSLINGKYETNTYEITEKFTDINIATDTADIQFKLSDNKKCIVECYEKEKEKHSVAVLNDTLNINVIDQREWFDFICINSVSPKITVYLPEIHYSTLLVDESTGDIEIPKDFKFENANISLSTGDVEFSASAEKLINIEASTGDINLRDNSAEEIILSTSTGGIYVSNIVCQGNINTSVSTGKTHLTDVECQNLLSSGDTGDLSLTGVIAKEKFSIERDTGDVNFQYSDANEIFIETDTGDISGSLLSDKVYIIETDTGDIDVPKTITGGRCEITTDTGDIRITVDN